MRLINADRFIHEVRSRVSDVIFRGVEATMVFGGDSCNPAEWTRGYEAGTIAVANMIELQPTVDAEPVKHGRWIDNHCSACGMMPMGEEIWDSCDFAPPKFEQFMDYCPNCGAKMDLEG